ncbi:hypothetical protein [Laribacter hongkongensis]|uniref:Uncharacterized protein n=1 Tax=Laribacter hongkongensis TaxID=168471 RepID=A0A248LLP3_9NEIS|nr:hypothetical protein [Laribacter hongkongensis]ASJ25419.1 hypothetical protein LHGZ1_2588 [Laribacter hongkongensis]
MQPHRIAIPVTMAGPADTGAPEPEIAGTAREMLRTGRVHRPLA